MFFRSLVAALLPLMVGGLAIVGTFFAAPRRQRARLDLDLRPQPDHGPGLGLAIDYSLFMVRRYREEIAKTGPGSRR